MKRVETLLRREIGLDASSVGPTLVERAARLRMKSLGLDRVDDYLRLLESSSAEREELVEAVVVTETWFFRDPDSFATFTQQAREWLLKNPVGPIRLLSVPCSTGEEPYTLAMCLLDARVPVERFVIDAVDISARSLARAIRGQYGKNSFRGKDLAFRTRHFRQHKDVYLLNQTVRDCVRFEQDNLLSATFLSGRAPYHFVFCRNVLIYFDRPTQMKVLEALRMRLANGGLLFVGPAELPILLGNGFVSAGLPMAFACRKAEDAPTTRRTERRARAAPAADATGLSIQPLQSERKHAHVDAGGAKVGSADSKHVRKDKPAFDELDLEHARRLADEGKLKEAAEICEASIRQSGPSAQAYYLLGLVLDAGGDVRAADYYRKALYLEPDHYESLWHMALLLEKNGDAAGARTFKRRAERSPKKA